MSEALSRWLFDQVHSRNLVYNQCWEDPAVDNEVLNIGPSDRIVMITSAGCNALDYMIHDPAGIYCIDVNPHQNALLELKIAALEALRYDQFFARFPCCARRNSAYSRTAGRTFSCWTWSMASNL